MQNAKRRKPTSEDLRELAECVVATVIVLAFGYLCLSLPIGY